MKKVLKRYIKQYFPWLKRLNRPVNGFMAKMNPREWPEEGKIVFFENGIPFTFQNSRHKIMEKIGGSRCGLWDKLLFFSRPDCSKIRLAMPIIQSAPKRAILASPALAALYAEYTPRLIADFITPSEEQPAKKEPHRLDALSSEEDTFPHRLANLLQQAELSISNDTPHEIPHFILITHGLSSGGAERQWCYLACELARRGYAVSLLVDSLSGSNGHYLPLFAGSPVAIYSMETFLLPQTIESSSPSEIPSSVSRYIQALRFLQPTHVLCQLDFPNLIAGAAALLAGNGIQKVLLSFRNVNPSHFSYIHLPWMLSWYQAMLHSPRVVLSGNSTAGNADYAQWLGLPAQKVAYIPNTLELDSTQSIRPREETRRLLDIPEDARVILGVFRLSPEKNPLLFLRVIQRLCQSYPDLVVLHAGEGYIAETIHDAASKLDLSRRIHFLGRREDIPDLMVAADMLLLCSDHEGLPNVLIEAQAMELSIVTTEAGSVRDAVVPGETALTVPCGDLEGLVSNSKLLLEDSKKRQYMGQAGRLFVQTHFTTKALAENTLRTLGL